VNESIFNQFRMTVAERGLGLYGALIYTKKDGSVAHRWRSDDKVCLYSGSKTFTSLAIGICVDEGRLKISDRVVDFFPEYKNISASADKEICIRDLLHMASGKGVFMFSVDEQTLYSTDWAELFFKEPQVREPGTFFLYSNACTYMLSRIVEKVSGETLRNYLLPRLFTPLGILNPQWHTCPRGHSLGGTGLFLTTEEFSRLGITLLHRGLYKDKRIVSEKYVAELSSDIFDNKDCEFKDVESKSGYGYQVWKCSHEDAYRADGLYGQFSIVVPSKSAVVTVTAHEEKVPNDILRAVYKDILPSL
jgi:CubicO group peptidase (beta-lactamase class C family)